MIGAGALALAGVAWVVRPRATPPAAIDAPALAAIDAGGAVVGPGVALTALGACANEPVFVDGTTVAFTLMRGADVDVYTVVPGQAPALAARSPGDAWDWHPARGRHPGEILYVTDGDDQRMRVKALSRATGGISEPMVGYAVAPTDAATFVLTDADPGWVHRHDGAGDARAVAVDAQADYLAASRDGARLAFVVADRASAPRLCVATVATARVECVAALKPHNVDPVFARDGRTLYYAAESGVRAIDLATGADRLVVPGVRTSGGLDVSPDGARLVYSDCHSYGTLIAVGRGAPEALVDDGLARSPVGIPGGGLAWVARDPGGGVRLMVRSGAEPARALLRVDGELGRPAFSADGRAAAWAQGGASPGIHSAPVAGGAPRGGGPTRRAIARRCGWPTAAWPSPGWSTARRRCGPRPRPTPRRSSGWPAGASRIGSAIACWSGARPTTWRGWRRARRGRRRSAWARSAGSRSCSRARSPTARWRSSPPRSRRSSASIPRPAPPPCSTICQRARPSASRRCCPTAASPTARRSGSASCTSSTAPGSGRGSRRPGRVVGGAPAQRLSAFRTTTGRRARRLASWEGLGGWRHALVGAQ